MAEPLKLLAASVVEGLAEEVVPNLERYRSGNFHDHARSNGWAIETHLATWDPALAQQLDSSGTPAAEIRNSLLIWEGLKGVTPALAREERLWARLCHVEFLDYARERWLSGSDDERDIKKHFFAKGVPGCRDDNAIGRLWWNGHIAAIATPDNVELGLQRLLGRANTRMHIIERANTSFRGPLIQGIVRLIGCEPWLNNDDRSVEDFMFDLRKRSGGVAFEALQPAEVDAHLRMCLAFAQARKPRTTAAAA
jgi:hypothetical protein